VNILIAGASGNLGSHIAQHLFCTAHQLRLLTHKRRMPFDLPPAASAEIVQADLDEPQSLSAICRNIDCIVYVAGVLFQPRPEKYLPRTNTIYLRNLADAALSAGVGKFILGSFPHVEENSTPGAPAKGILEVEPQSIHARTRLEAERYLFKTCAMGPMVPVVLRTGVVYGRGVKLIEAARWLMRKHLLAIWRGPTRLHLLALPDFLSLIQIAIEKRTISGIYNLCDDCPLLLQEFLDRLALHWGYPKPWRMPAFVFRAAAALCESIAGLFSLCHAVDARYDSDGYDLRRRRHQRDESRDDREASLPND